MPQVVPKSKKGCLCAGGPGYALGYHQEQRSAQHRESGVCPRLFPSIVEVAYVQEAQGMPWVIT
jgi:hypothetical protein